MPANNISLMAPNDYSVEAQAIERRRKLAELMQQQSMAPLEAPPNAGGWAIPISPFAGAAKMLQAYSGGVGQRKADEKMKALAERLRGDRQGDLSALMGGMQGRPAQTIQPDPQEISQSADYGTPPVQPATTPAISAGQINPAIISQLRTPEAQAMAMQMYQKQNEPYTLAADAQRRGPGNQVVATNPKPQQPFTLTPGGTRFGPDGKPIVALPEKIDYNKPFLPDGRPNPAYQKYEMGKTLAGRPNVQTDVHIPPASKVFENENKLRDDYTTASKPFVGIRDAYNTIQSALSGPITAVSTLAGATKFMKMIDPESVVRESELQMALKATGMFDRFLNLHNTVMKGQVLTPNQAAEIKTIADTLYQAAQQQQAKTDQYFNGLATEYGLSPKRVTRNQSAVMAPPPGIDMAEWNALSPDEKALWNPSN